MATELDDTDRLMSIVLNASDAIKRAVEHMGRVTRYQAGAPERQVADHVFEGVRRDAAEIIRLIDARLPCAPCQDGECGVHPTSQWGKTDG
jgi:hypothetical protein